VLGQARPQVLLDLVEEPEIAQPSLVDEEEPHALGDRGAAAELGAALLADPLGVARGTEADEGGLEPGGVEAEPGGGRGADAAGGAQRVEQLVPLAPLERSREAVVIEERVELGLPGRVTAGAAKAPGQLREDRAAPGAVAAEQALELGATFGVTGRKTDPAEYARPDALQRGLAGVCGCWFRNGADLCGSGGGAEVSCVLR
jgi:hypothetical protein